MSFDLFRYKYNANILSLHNGSGGIIKEMDGDPLEIKKSQSMGLFCKPKIIINY